jgi:lysozyme family protein
VDGLLGKQTIQAINNREPDRFIADYTLAKIARYVSLCNNNRSQSKFLLGWLNRAFAAMT